MNEIASLLGREPQAVNIGVRGFAESLAAQNVPVVQVDWAPSPTLDDDVAALLEALG